MNLHEYWNIKQSRWKYLQSYTRPSRMQSRRNRCIKIIKEIQVNPRPNVFTLFQISRVDVHEIVFSFIPSRKETNPRDRTRDFPPPILFDSLFFSIGWSTLLPILIPKGIIRATTVPGTLRPAIVPASSKNPPSDASSYCARGPNTEFLRRVSGHVTTVKRSVICHGHDKWSSTTVTPRV